MKRSAGALLFLLATTPMSAQQLCHLQSGYNWTIAAPPAKEGVTVTLEASGLFGCLGYKGPYACDPGTYVFGSCETLQWSFGDGATATVNGSGSVFHAFAHWGVYNVKVHIVGQDGSADVARSVYVASSPGTAINAGPPVYANESDGSVTVHLTRSGDLSLTNRVDWNVGGVPKIVTPLSGSVTFLPGETDHTVTLSIVPDHLYEGEYGYSLNWNLAADGAVAGTGSVIDALHVQSQIDIHDTEQKPAGALRDVVVSKGSPVADVPIDLSGAFASPNRWWVDWREVSDSAVDGVDFAGSHPSGSYLLPPNTVHPFIAVPLIDNPQPGTRKFEVEVTNAAFPLTRSRATVTIVDDSFRLAADPTSLNLVAGSDAKLSLSSSAPLIAPVTATIVSGDPAVFSTSSSTAIIPVEGTASIVIHALKPGHATLTITPAGGAPATVDVQVVPGRRRAVSR